MTQKLWESRRWMCLGLLLAGIAIASPVQSGQFKLQWDRSNSTVSADITEAPLLKVLEQIQMATGWEVFVEPGIDLPVSTAFQDLKMGKALSRLLSNANFALVPSDDKSKRLMVFQTSRDSATEKLQLRMIDPEDARRIEDELLITVESKEEAERIAKEFGAEIIGGIDELGTYRLKFKDAESADKARAELESREAVDVNSNYEIKRPVTPKPLAGSQLPLPPIRAGSSSGEQLIIGLVDTAVQIPGGPLGEFFLNPVSVAGVSDTGGFVPKHATSMANDILYGMAEIVGTGGSSATKILSVDVFGPSEETTTFQLGHGLIEAWNGGATLINASLGSKDASPWLDGIINQLASQGAVILAPSGNIPDGLPTYPAANPNVIEVTATAPGGGFAEYANVTPTVDVALPGNSVVTLTGEAYFVNGTSSATAKATGIIAGYAEQTNGTIQEGRTFLIQAKGIGQ